jgi:hypothetical protein
LPLTVVVVWFVRLRCTFVAFDLLFVVCYSLLFPRCVLLDCCSVLTAFWFGCCFTLLLPFDLRSRCCLRSFGFVGLFVPVRCLVVVRWLFLLPVPFLVVVVTYLLLLLLIVIVVFCYVVVVVRCSICFVVMLFVCCCCCCYVGYCSIDFVVAFYLPAVVIFNCYCFITFVVHVDHCLFYGCCVVVHCLLFIVVVVTVL